jgi:hypothetical protein
MEIFDGKPTKEPVEIKIQKQQELEYTLRTRVRYIPGLILWEFDLNTFELNKATVDKKIILDFDGKPRTQNKVIYKNHCWYFQSHNLRAAVKKVNKFMKIHFNIEQYLKIVEK